MGRMATIKKHLATRPFQGLTRNHAALPSGSIWRYRMSDRMRRAPSGLKMMAEINRLSSDQLRALLRIVAANRPTPNL